MITVIQNNSITFDISPYLVDRGWSILSPTSIKHTTGNSGFLEYLNLSIGEGLTYEYSFTVETITSGSLKVYIGGELAKTVTTNGYYEGHITTSDDSNIKFWADGDVIVKDFNIKLLIADRNGKEDTITWSEQRKKWVTFKDIIPESGFSMFTSMFTLKNGKLWKHVIDGATPNNFYGVQYHSLVKFPVSSVGVKTYQSIAIHSNKVIGTTENGIETQLGNVTDLITYDFESREGIHYANKLRDAIMDDKLKGRYIVIELTDEESADKYLQIFKIVLKSTVSTPNE